MSKFKHFTTEERRAIINLHNDGKTYREIARIFQKTVAAVFKVVRTFKNDARLIESKRSGRPRITNKKVDSKIINLSSADPFLSAPKIRGKLVDKGYEVPSVSTIRRRLRENDKQGRVARRIPYISKINLKKT